MLRSLAFAVCLALVAGPMPLSADDLLAPHQARIAALREAHDLAAIETYCRQQLSRTALLETERHTLTLELAQTSLEHALEQPRDAALWESAEQTPIAYAEQSPKNPRIVQLWVQSALAHLAHGDALAPLALDTGANRAPAGDEWSAAIKQLRQSRDWLEVESRTAPRSAPKNLPEGAIPPFTVEELRSLDRHTAFILAETYRRQAEAYALGSEDRQFAASQAQELYFALVELPDNNPLAWPSRVRLVGMYRLLQDWPAATQALTHCAENALPAEQLATFRSESMRLFLARNNVAEALRIADQPPGDQAHTWEEDVAILETNLEAARSNETASPSPALYRKLTAHLAAIGDRWGTFRHEQAIALVAQEFLAEHLTGDADLWGLAGDSLLQRGRRDEALQAFDHAQSLAEAAQQIDAAMSQGAKAAAVERSQQHFAESAARLRKLSLAHPQHPQAAPLHLLSLNDAAKAEATDAELREQLEKHLRVWPNDASAKEVRALLADENRNEQ